MDESQNKQSNTILNGGVVEQTESLRFLLRSGNGTIKHDSFWQNKGDLAVAVNRNQAGRLTPGTDGQYLKSDSTAETGYSWGTPSGGGGAQCATFVVGPSSNSDSADYDYVTDGTDDDVQIQAAIDALPAGGGKILLREGTYTIGTQIDIDDTNITLEGMGGSTIIQPETNYASLDTTYIFQATSSYTHIKNIHFYGNYSNGNDYIAAVYVYTYNYEIWFDNCLFSNLGGGALKIDTSKTVHVTNCFFNEWDTGAIGIDCIYGGSEVLHTQYSITGCYFYTASTDAMGISDAEYGSYIGYNEFVIPTNYNSVLIVSGGLVEGNYIHNSGALGNSAFLIQLDIGVGRAIGNHIEAGAASGLSVGIRSIGCIVVGNYVSGPGYGVYGSYIIKDNYIDSVGRYGIYVSSSHSTISGNKILRTGQETNDTYDSIYINANVDRCIVTNNNITNTGTNKHRYGINVSAATCDNNIVSNNVVLNGVSGQINDSGTGTVTDGSNVTS